MNIFKLIFLCLLFFLYCDTVVFCQDLMVSFIDKTDKNNVKIELNQTLLLKGFKLKNVNSNIEVIIPGYVKNNIQYPYFSFLDLRFKSYIINSIKSNTINGKPTDAVTYKVSRIRQNFTNSNIQASTFVTFNDLIEIECFIVNNKKNNLTVLWPSIQNKDNGSVLVFAVKDLTLKSHIENEILNRYKIERKTE